jgi:hypothetical protein
VSLASAEEIGRLAASAYCRDESGQVRNPRVRPAERAEAARAARGMVKTAVPVEGIDCYFYLSEVALGPPKPCSSPNVGGQDKKIAGTLDVKSCADR